MMVLPITATPRWSRPFGIGASARQLSDGRIVFVDQRHGVAADAAADHIDLAADRGERDLVARRGQRLLHGPGAVRRPIAPGCGRASSSAEQHAARDQQQRLTELRASQPPQHIGALIRSQIQPCSSRSTRCEITAIPASLSLRHGIAAKFSPPFALKICGVLDRDLLQRFQAIGGEAGRHHREVLHAALRQRLDGLVGVGLQPFGAAEARLERQHQLVFVELRAARAAAAPSRRNGVG